MASESRSEPPGVAKDSSTLNTIVRTPVPIDPEAFPPAIEKSGTENERNIPRVFPKMREQSTCSNFHPKRKAAVVRLPIRPNPGSFDAERGAAVDSCHRAMCAEYQAR